MIRLAALDAEQEDPMRRVTAALLVVDIPDVSAE